MHNRRGLSDPLLLCSFSELFAEQPVGELVIDQGIHFHFSSGFDQAVKIDRTFYIILPAAPFAYGAAASVTRVHTDHPVYADKRFEFLFTATVTFWKHIGYIK